MTPKDKCKDHPDAPHGFCRDESITQDRYVCECEFWEPPKAVEQEPVAWMYVNLDGECEEIGYGKDYLKGSEFMSEFQPLYTAPVRTKDLTDDEIRFWIGRFPFLLNEESEKWIIGFARAVIAAYREKNK